MSLEDNLYRERNGAATGAGQGQALPKGSGQP